MLCMLYINRTILKDSSSAWFNLILRFLKCFTAYTVKQILILFAQISLSQYYDSSTACATKHFKIHNKKQKLDHAELLSLSIIYACTNYNGTLVICVNTLSPKIQMTKFTWAKFQKYFVQAMSCIEKSKAYGQTM